MSKRFKIILAILILAAAGYFGYQKMNRQNQDRDIEAMKSSIVAEPKIAVSDITPQQKEKLLKQLKDAQNTLIGFNFDNLQAVNDVARLKKALGDIDGAITAWEYANIIRPNNSLSFSNLAALYHYDLKDYEKAERNYLISIANDPDDINTVRNLFEMYYYAVKDNTKAEALLLGSIENNPESSDLFALTGSFYAETDRIDKAIEYYEKALALSPNNQAIKKEIERLKKL